jgi:hypothetical protein
MLSFNGSTGTVKSNGLTITKAMYGIQNTFTDVTTEVQNLYQNNELNFTVSAQELGILDPAPGVKKTLQIQYSINGGKVNLMSKEDSEQVILTVPSVPVPDEKKNVPSVLGSLWYGIAACIIMLISMSAYAYTANHTGQDQTSTIISLAPLVFLLTFVTYGHLMWLIFPVVILTGAYYGY